MERSYGYGNPAGRASLSNRTQIKFLLDRLATGQRGARLDTKEQQQANRQHPAHYRLFQVEPIWAKAMLLGIPGLSKWEGERQTASEVVYQLQELAACVRAAIASTSPATKASEPTITPEATAAAEPARQSDVLVKTSGQADKMIYYVTLDQAAALVNRNKRTLERKKKKMPAPAVKGGGGKPTEWIWSELRPWLEKEFGRRLPEVPPHAAGRH
jgi:hypothetical protein